MPVFRLRWLSGLALCGVILAQQGPSLTPRKTGDRYVTLPDFPDAGLTAGPRDIHVFLPHGYSSGQERYRVIYFHDGEGVFGGLDGSRGVFVDADYAIDELLAENLIHPAILVAVANTRRIAGGRSIDLVPRWNANAAGRIDDYYTFLSRHLKPYIDTHFRTRPEPQFTGVSGNSLGGLASFYLAYRHPETFGFAGCTSPSLWLMDSQLVGETARDGKGKTPVRFWLDAGERDSADIETVTPRMVKVLASKGWTEGDDLAYQLGYGHLHGRTAQRERMRNMLYFLLRKQAPAIRGISLRTLADPNAGRLRLETAGDRAYLWPEIQYEHGFYLNAVTAQMRIDNAAVASMDAEDPGRIRNSGPGAATLTAGLAGWKAWMPVEGYRAGDYVRYGVKSADSTVAVDGSLEEWKSLPHAIDPPSGAEAARARFATAYDARFLYVAVDVTDSRLVIRPDRPLTEQDAVEIWLDARPGTSSSISKAWADGFQDTFLLARVAPAMSPSREVEMQRPSFRVALPDGLLRACRRTARGYSAEFAIPVSYLNTMQGAVWREFRLNVHVADFVSTGDPKVDLWWKPAWRSLESAAGSGMFRRQ